MSEIKERIIVLRSNNKYDIDNQLSEEANKMADKAYLMHEYHDDEYRKFLISAQSSGCNVSALILEEAERMKSKLLR